MIDDPRATYERRCRQWRTTAEHLAGRERAVSLARLGVFLAAVSLAWVIFVARLLPVLPLVVPVVVFLGLVLAHDRIIRGRRRAERAVGFYRQGLARMDGRWAGSGVRGEEFLDREHPYVSDLDVFGEGSVFELLCTARTQGGEETIADWLSRPATVPVIRARQDAVSELRPMIDLREELAVLGADVRAGLHPSRLREWGARPPLPGLTRLRVVALVLSLLPIVAVGVGLVTGIGFFLVPISIALVLGFTMLARGLVEPRLGAFDRTSAELALFSSILERFERERFRSSRLSALQAELEVDGRPPSRRIAGLQRLQELLDARRNLFFAPIALLSAWEIQLGLAIESWRALHGPRLADWIEAIGELEALVALGGYAYEHPNDPFPQIEEGGGRFHGEQIGHPLLPEATCVRNDVRLDDDRRLLVVSGSNMSGKSTLLRTVGINAVLAQAGAPTRSGRLRLSPLAVGASIRINDSLQKGTSRFYEEIKRVARLMEIAQGDRPLLFLLDEILHGTNSHDRRIGAEAIAVGLVERGAIGLVTTHDLALAHIVETLAPRAGNVHFEDHIEDGRIRFDYRMRPGVGEKSNALQLMRTVGIPV